MVRVGVGVRVRDPLTHRRGHRLGHHPLKMRAGAAAVRGRLGVWLGLGLGLRSGLGFGFGRVRVRVRLRACSLSRLSAAQQGRAARPLERRLG